MHDSLAAIATSSCTGVRSNSQSAFVLSAGRIPGTDKAEQNPKSHYEPIQGL